MKTNRKSPGVRLLDLCFFLPLLMCGNSIAQVANLNPGSGKNIPSRLTSLLQNDLFGTSGSFIENIGQYKDTLASYGRMGRILYGYEGLDMPVLFTAKGLIHLQRATKKLSHEEMERLEKKGWKERDIIRNYTINRTVSMEWVNANPYPGIITEEENPDYFTYGLLAQKAKAYRKITYKELYPGIDLVYSFVPGKKGGFEYSLIAKPGADISNVKMKYGGDIKNILQDKNGNLVIASDAGSISVSAAKCYYGDNSTQKFTSPFKIINNSIHFKLPGNYDRQKTLVIDPFVSGTGGLSGTDGGKAKDIDFDYAGNIYVVGGGDGTVQRLSKYNASGALQWTFNGSLSSPSWNFGGAHGGWVVEKISGNIYLGQGLAGGGFRIIRLNSGGSYDNYITPADPLFAENWKMLWNCNGGTPKILIAGGGSTSNIELAYLSPPSTSIHASNITGMSTGHNDISDIVSDPVSNDLYTIFSTSVLNPGGDNNIYKHKAPYSPADMAWTRSPGYFALREPSNRPYMNGLDNSSNTLAVNSRYLFYWDGKNLEAFNKSDGSAAGSPLTLSSNAVLMQGGIIADECNNVFAGSSNGIIKVFNFTGSAFDDNAAPDISITGNPSAAVYDLAYDQGKNFLYACGNGFVASFDLSTYCTATVYNVNLNSDCSSLSVTASVSPAPPTGSVVTYELYDGAVLVSSNTIGIFTSLTAGKNYRIVAVINQSCSGTRAVKDFTTAAPPLLKVNNPAGICGESIVDLTDPAVTAGSAPGLTFTYWLDAAATIPHPDPTKTKAGIYYIKAATSAGCSVIAPVEVKPLTSPRANAGTDTVACSGDNIQLKGSGGVSYLWTPDTYLNNAAIANPVVKNPGTSGSITYRLKVKDVNGCESQTADEVKVTFATPATVFIDADSVVAINQPLQLNAIDPANGGFIDYRWSPTYGLNNPFIKDPVAKLDRDITYTVQATNTYHCTATARISIRVFRGPEIYVPNSFTPNGDGLNDVLKPIPVGLVEFHYLKIFNRFGQLLFTITDPAKGWDGKINGREQDYGTFIWIGEGIDYKGNIIMRKGATTIIR